MVEVLVFSTSIQRALISYDNDKGIWPLNNGEARLSEKDNLPSTYIKRIEDFDVSRWPSRIGVC